MKQRKRLLCICLMLGVVLTGCKRINPKIDDVKSTPESSLSQIEISTTEKEESLPQEETRLSIEEVTTQMELEFKDRTPVLWGEKMDGVVDQFETQQKAVALTLDACGGPNGSGFDSELIDFLIQEDIHATLFINRKWIEKNEETFLELASNPLFEIGNHGYEHSPLSVVPNQVYGIDATGSIAKTIEEIRLNEDLIYELTDKKPTCFRSGTAYYDDVAVAIAQKLGYRLAGFRINADAGATFSAEQIVASMSSIQSGDIIIGHFNQPNKQTYEGLKPALKKLKQDGYEFLTLEQALDEKE